MNTYSRSNMKKKPLPIVSFALCGLFLASCSNNDKDTTTLPPETTALAKSTLLSVQVLDPNGATIEGATVNITSDPDDIIPNTQESQLTGAAPAGIVTYTPNEFSGTKSLQIIASKDGFLANNIPYTVTGGETNEASIVITSISSNNVTGISASSTSGDSTTGAIVATAKEGDQPEDSKTIVKIKTDPGATTADGTPLGDTLSVVVAQYDHDEPESQDAFPGGFSASIENPGDLNTATDQPADGVTPTDGNVIFESAGFTAIEVKDDQGNVAKNFNKPVEVSTKIKSDFVNPMTGATIKAGDTIPIWSFEASTGKWRYEKTGTVVDDPDGGLKVDYTVTHLSYYNLDYFRGGRCDATVTFRDTNGSVHALSGRVSSQGWSHRFKYPGDDVLTLRNSPSDRLVSFNSLKTVTGQNINVVTPNTPVNLCDASPLTVIIDPPAVEYSELTASAKSYCSNDSTVAEVPISGTYIWIYSNTWSHIGSAKTNSDGETNFRLPVGTYKVQMYDVTNRAYIFNTVTLTTTETGSTELRVPQTCEVTTGGSVSTPQ